ncbi:MAG: outer membrane beta-barrel protein [Verrucomicrobiae bacterium]|nr:outer membrane beta-barrel protein [Verrucomicrobiae bacterium]
MKHNVILILAAVLSLMPHSVRAGDKLLSGGVVEQPVEDRLNYAGIRGGIGWVDQKGRDAGPFQSSIEFEHAFNLTALYGRRFEPWLRAEFEFAVFNMEVDDVKTAGSPQRNVSGTERQFAFLFNVLFDWKNSTKFTPFIGLGVGPALTHMDKTFLGTALGNTVTIDDTDVVGAGQVLAGVAYEIDPEWTLELLYRGYATTEQKYAQTGGVQTSARVEETLSHNINLGLRYGF